MRCSEISGPQVSESPKRETWAVGIELKVIDWLGVEAMDIDLKDIRFCSTKTKT